jgi:hypothetical protein
LRWGAEPEDLESRTWTEPMPESPITLERALERAQRAYEELLRESPEEAERETIDRLMERLADLVEEDGSIALEDGSRLYLLPERGDRSGETGRLGAVQRFDDERPERIHLLRG